MTPEERAFEIIHSLTRHGADRNLPHTPAFSWKIEAAIRAAENDALERAALALESECWVPTSTPAMVRALKHKEAE